MVVFTLQTAGRCNFCCCFFHSLLVVFTFQTAGRCNTPIYLELHESVVFTFQTAGRCNLMDFKLLELQLFLPFKQQADATVCINLEKYLGCFYLANSRQMQQSFCFRSPVVSCFYLANSRQMQQDGSEFKIDPSCFYLANSRQMQHKRLRTLFWIVVFTLQTAGRCNKVYISFILQKLFLPCKQQADATHLT